jgi:membrane protein required for colicin V production
MNWLDFTIIILIAGFVLSGWSAGLVRGVVTLAASIVGVIVAGALYERFSHTVEIFISDPEAADAVAFLILFGSVYLLGQILTIVLRTSLTLLMVGWWDRPGGAVFGFLKGVIVVQVLLIAFAAYPSLGLNEAVDESSIARHFVDDWSFLLAILPTEIEDRVDGFLVPTPPPTPSPSPVP